MDKKNTILLTVVAIATLLVAVVGATFAFFASSQTNDANVSVQAKTAAGADQFNATGSGELAITVGNNVMLEKDAAVDKVATSDTDNNMNISLTAGSGKATCTYDLKWTETVNEANGIVKYAPTAELAANSLTKEYTIAATAGEGLNVEEINISAIPETGVLGNFKIENIANEDATQAATTQTWTFTLRFYNQNIDQKAQMGQTHAGNIAVSNVVCDNTAV